jgi:Bifunctional DNA primase/polymerase, N-terminal
VVVHRNHAGIETGHGDPAVRGTLEEALALAEQGLAVLPCWPDKRPACRHGCHDATTDPERIRRWWWVDRLIGVATGARSGLAVLDVDPRHDGLDWLEAHADKLPETRVHETRGGGFHLIYRYQAGVRNSAGLIAPGIDTRGDSGLIVWWSSCGIPALREVPLAELAPWPSWLLPAVQEAPEPPCEAHSGAPNRSRVEGLLRWLAARPEGQRNSSLFWASCRMREMLDPEALPAERAGAALLSVAVQIGLSEQEARRTIRSGFSR